MSFKDKVEKIILEMSEGRNLEGISKKVKDRALVELLRELPAQIQELFEKRLKEVDKMIEQRVKTHLEKGK